MNLINLPCHKQQRYEEAEELFTELLEKSYRVLGPLDQITIESIGKIFDLYEAWNKPEKAEEWRAKLPETEAAEE